MSSHIRTYLRPTAFLDSPFGHENDVARLAGGLAFFAMVELVVEKDGRRTPPRLVPVAAIEGMLDDHPEARAIWSRLTAPRAPLQLGSRVVRLDQPQVVGILNVTPDSFSDGGRHEDPAVALAAGHEMAAAGAAIIDVGGESTRPGSKPVWEGDEIGRVEPVVRGLSAAGIAVSLDTRKAAVMEKGLAAGAGMINDVSALTWDPEAARVVAAADCPVVLMHHLGTPDTMQDNPRYDRPVAFEIYDWLEARIEAAVAAGVSRERIIVDPGFGFGKTVQHNMQLMNALALLHGLGCPVMIGASRKRTIGALSNEAAPDDRLGGSIALALKAAEQGVQLMRVHDAAETIQGLRLWRGLRDAALTPTI